MREIKISNICKSYKQAGGSVKILDGIDITIAPGEFFFLLGPSGCGKTTLLRIICGLLEPTSGSVYFDGEDVTQLPVQRRDTAMVFQNYALWPHMTVQKNTEFGLEMKGVSGSERAAEARRNLQLVEMADYASRKPNQLSGGQQQRVALARAIASKPKCLLLDEPLSNLDAKLRIQMRSELRSLVKSSGITGVYVTHDQKEALSMADRIAIMYRGRVEQVGTPIEIYERPRTAFVADFVGEVNFIEGKLTKEAQHLIVASGIGPVKACINDLYRNRTAGKCCIRPEKIRMTAAGKPKPEGCDNCIEATVRRSIYLGESFQYEVELKDGNIWKVSVTGERKALDLKEVNLFFHRDDVILLER